MSYWVRIEPVRPGIRFSSVEVFQILVAMGVLTLAFTLSYFGGITGVMGLFDYADGLLVLGLVALASFLAVVTAFLLHELAHKVVAQRYGCFAEFRYQPMGLVVGLLTGLFGFVFAAPGAVMISGPITSRQHVRISAMGPATNLGLAIAFIAMALVLGTANLVGFLGYVISSIAFINLFLGLFNLLPFPPLDGSKIFALNRPLWIGMIAAVVIVGVAGWYAGVIWF